MAIVRSYANGFELVDRTEDIIEIPNTWGLCNSLGIFGAPQGVSQHSIILEKIVTSGAVVLDRVRGERNNVSKDYTRAMHAFAVPHFPLDDALTPGDIQGKRAFGSPEQPETLDKARLRKMERIRRSHAQMLETARMYTLTTGAVYAPNGTVVDNFFTSFGLTQKQVTFTFTTTTTDIIAKCEEVIAHIQDNILTGEVPSEIIGICSPTFFAALISHATVKEAYKYYSSNQQVLRDRMVAPGLDARFRQFVFGGIRFIEYRGVNYSGTAYVPTSHAVFVPLGTPDSFETYFSPAYRFEYVNTPGEELYMFEYLNDNATQWTIETESNPLNVLRHPYIVVDGLAN